MIYDPNHRYFDVHVPFLSTLGVVALGKDEATGTAELKLEMRHEFSNSHDALHGGAIATLLDVAMAAAARSKDASIRVTTIEMSVHYMKAARAPVLYARGKLNHLTGSLAFTEAELHDGAGEVFAKATGTFKKLRAP
jgi:uncharacterized protein (TIGR00369 family)